VPQESSLHVALKDLYSRPKGQKEIQVNGYWIDVVTEEEFIEIQTRNFSALKPKLNALLELSRVRLVHPIPSIKWILKKFYPDGVVVKRQKSPKSGRPEDLFYELVRIPALISHPRLTIELLLIEEEETRVNDGKGSWRRKGWSIVDRKLIRILQARPLNFPSDYLSFLPNELPEIFSTNDVAVLLKVKPSLARKLIYCLRQSGLIAVVGKKDKQLLYCQLPEP
jgi:hypothetical protein